MAKSELLAPIILMWEGGWADDPLDRGGCTMMGVTIATYRTYCRKKGRTEPTCEDLKKITESEWQDIFKTMYWDKWKADCIDNQSIANILVDWIWASGYATIKNVQGILKVDTDGIVGTRTLAALNFACQKYLFREIHDERIKFVEAIVARDTSQARFINGWKNRINYFKYSEI